MILPALLGVNLATGGRVQPPLSGVLIWGGLGIEDER
jgi:hypothetical protein